MSVILKIFIYLCLCAGLHCVDQMPWLPCQFFDEHIFVNHENHTETQFIHKDTVLQFGKKGDAPVNPHAITFLVTGSKLDLRDYVQGVGAERLDCELRWFSTEGIQLRWPSHGAQEYDCWFRCTLKHTAGHFTVNAFLRHTPAQRPSDQQDYRSRPAIGDRDLLPTSVAMVLQTLSPSVLPALSSQQKLHCQFAIDHKGPNAQVEWHRQTRGERLLLFSHASRSGQTKGSGVGLKALVGGDASFTLPLVKLNSEGTYICSVSVPPLLGSVDVTLHVQERPRVSLNVGSSLVLTDGTFQKVACEAEGYYPLDVEIVWYQEQPGASGKRVGAPLPKKVDNILLSSHKHNQEGTYSLSAFFYLQASLSQSGYQYTCTVSHQSLLVPIRKSFTLTVEEPTSWTFYFLIAGLLAVLCPMLCYWYKVRRESMKQRKPY
ncbi:tapasin isoform X1 [Myripristis murdjan]|uniref:tapasin isoform X1 n=2 Tax=Myripristis murdjan TaxID=586833 RepID=UPI0011763556|nr:tapasin-like isoform X1 [Myripristis murdjan]